MSALQTHRDLVAEIHAGFLDAGMAGLAQYTAPAATGSPAPVAVPVRVFVQRGLGDVGPATGLRTEIGILRADASGRRGGTLVLDGETWRLERPSRDDAAVTWWHVERVEAAP